MLLFAFYPCRKTSTPVLLGIARVGVYLVMAFGLVKRYGMIGPVVANLLQFIARALLLGWLLHREGATIFNRTLRRMLVGVAAGVVVMGVAVLFAGVGLDSLAGIEGTYGAPVWEQVARVVVPAALGAGASAIALKVRQVQELTDLHRIIGHTLKRR